MRVLDRGVLVPAPAPGGDAKKAGLSLFLSLSLVIISFITQQPPLSSPSDPPLSFSPLVSPAFPLLSPALPTPLAPLA